MNRACTLDEDVLVCKRGYALDLTCLSCFGDMLSSRLFGSMSSLVSPDIASNASGPTDQEQASMEVQVFRRYRKGYEPRTTRPSKRGSILPGFVATDSQNRCCYTDIFTVKP